MRYEWPKGDAPADWSSPWTSEQSKRYYYGPPAVFEPVAEAFEGLAKMVLGLAVLGGFVALCFAVPLIAIVAAGVVLGGLVLGALARA